MKTFRLALAADLHLASPLAYLPEKAAGALRAAQLKSFVDLCKYCAQQKLDALFILGDLFDQNSPNKALLQAVQQSLNLCSQTKVFILPGNHDPYYPESFWEDEAWPSHVHIFKKNYECFEWPEFSLRIYAAPFLSQSSSTALFEQFDPALNPAYLNLLCLHGELVHTGTASRYNPIPRKWLESSSVDLALFGHIHQSTELLKLGRTHYLYPGALIGRGFDECGEKGFYAGSLNFNLQPGQETRQIAIDLKFISLHHARFSNLSLDLTPLAAVDDFYAALLAELEKSIKVAGQYTSLNFVRLRLEGEAAVKVDLDYLRAMLVETAFYLELEDNSHPPIDLESYRQGQNLEAYLVRQIYQAAEDLRRYGEFADLDCGTELKQVAPGRGEVILRKAIQKLFAQ